MKKFKIYAPPVLILIISILVMLSGGFLKRPFRAEDDVMKYMDNLKTDIEASNWDGAEDSLKHLKDSWSRVEKRVQFSVERDDMNKLTITLARIEGSLRAKSKESALIELYEALEHWEHLEK